MLSRLKSYRAAHGVQTSKALSCTYQPLQHDEIRILRLLPGNEEDTICCTLQHRLISSSEPTYIALSWAWGTPTKLRREIKVNGESHNIWPSLFVALLELRKRYAPFDIWIDALCINQSDEAEKMVQIPLMRMIYTQAEYVLIWLGEDGHDSKYLLDCVAANRTEQHGSARLVPALFHLLVRPWFQRLWAIQEFILHGADPRILCGTASVVTVSALHVLYQSFLENKDLLPFDEELRGRERTELAEPSVDDFDMDVARLPMLSLMVNLRSKFHENRQGGVPLIEAILATSNWLCTDSRDRLYALLGLLGANEMQSLLTCIHLDDKSTAPQIWTGSIKYILTTQGSHGFDLYQNFKIDQLSQQNTPSWVPDLDNAYKFGSWFTGSGHCLSHERCLHVNESTGILTVRGVICGELSDIVRFPEEMRAVRFTLAMRVVAHGLALRNSVKDLRFPSRWTSTAMEASILEDLWFVRFLHDVNQPLLLCRRLLLDSKSPFIDKLQSTLLRVEEEEFLDRFGRDQQQISHMFEAIWEMRPRLHWLQTRVDAVDLVSSFDFNAFLGVLVRGLLENTFFLCSDGEYGMAKGDSQPGDVLALLYPPAYLPFIIREQGDKYRLVGPAHIHKDRREVMVATVENRLEDLEFI
jgi:hypothetical protein